MSAIVRSATVSAEVKKIIEELIWVFGLPEDCVLASSPEFLRIENDKRDHVLEISVEKNLTKGE